MQQESFDPYRKWLGIAPKDQPPHFYRLLGIDLFEGDPDVIANAADQRMTHLRTFQSGPNGALSQQILNEVSAARVCLLDDEKRAEYEAELREKLEPVTAMPAARAAAPRPETKRWRDEPEIDGAEVNSDSENGAAVRAVKKPLPRRTPQRAAAALPTRAVPFRKPAGRNGSRTLPLLLGIGGVGVVVIGALLFALSRNPSGQQPLIVSTVGADTKTVPVSITKPVPPPAAKPPIPVEKPPVVQPPPPPRPPRIEAVGNQTLEAGKPLEVMVRAESDEQPGRPLRYSLASAPPGASIVEDRGMFRFVAPQVTAEQSWNVVVRVAVADHAEQVATTSFEIRVRPAAVTRPPVNPIVRRPGFKSPVPSSEEIAAQVLLLRTQYAAEYADASQPGRQALAIKMRTEALRTSDLVRRYAMLSEIRDLAAANRDVTGIWQAIDLMEMTYDIDGTPLRADAVQKHMNPGENPQVARAVAVKYQEMMQRAQWSGRFLAAEKVIEPAMEAVALAGDETLRTTMMTASQNLRELAREEEAAEKAHLALREKPNDVEANFLWGRYLCLMRNDYVQGLPYLALGVNPAYQSAAKAELANPVDPAARKQTGDLWWAVQKNEATAWRQRAARRVIYWYGQARSGLDPAGLAEINARQAEMVAIISAPSKPITPPKIDKPAPEKPIADKPAPLPPIAEKPPTKPPIKPGARPEFKPLQGAALTAFVRAALKSGGRVLLKGSSNWVWKEEDLPAGDDLTVLGLVLEKNVADDAAVKNISRIHSLKELTLDSKGITSGAIHRLGDLTELTKLELTAPRLTDSFITSLQEMAALRTVALRGDQLGGANLEVLSGLQNLSSLEITGGRISEGTLVAIAKLEGLGSLMLRGGNYSPRAIDRLQSLPKLSSLTLQAFTVNDAVVTHVAELNSLTRLSLEGPIAGATLPALAKLENLTSLSIVSSLMEEKDLTAISQLSNLKRLTLKTKPLTNGALEKLSALKKLEALDIQTKGGFNESGLKHFDAMPRLTSAHLAGLSISLEGYEKFKKDHPNTYLSPKPDWGSAIGDKIKEWKDREKGKGGPPFGPRRPPGR